MFPKKLSINPNKNSTKVIKGKDKTFWWDIKKKKKHNTKTHILKKKKHNNKTHIKKKKNHQP